MTAALFIGLVVAVALGVIVVGWRFLPRSMAVVVTIGLPAWLAYVAALGASGLLADATLRPPAVVYLLGPLVVFVTLVLVRSPNGARIAGAIPLPLLIGAQVYRVGVELVLHRLWTEGIAPRMLTFEGANLDIWIALSAPLAAWLSARGPGGRRAALVWNALGLISLVNVAVRSALTTPGPLHHLASEVPNLMIGTFPFMFVPGFLAPLAVALHVLAIRALRARARTGSLDPARAFNQPTLI